MQNQDYRIDCIHALASYNRLLNLVSGPGFISMSPHLNSELATISTTTKGNPITGSPGVFSLVFTDHLQGCWDSLLRAPRTHLDTPLVIGRPKAHQEDPMRALHSSVLQGMAAVLSRVEENTIQKDIQGTCTCGMQHVQNIGNLFMINTVATNTGINFHPPNPIWKGYFTAQKLVEPLHMLAL